MTTIFYSWASDRPGKVCRHLIREALEIAVGRIGADLEESDRPQLTSDTKGVAGSPAIFPTIKKKILVCDIFVADLTPAVVQRKKRAIPNPNVMMELGIAEAHLTEEQIICVMNSAWGGAAPEALPFNLRHRRAPWIYSLMDDAGPAEVRKKRDWLANRLEEALRESLTSLPLATPTVPTPTDWTQARMGQYLPLAGSFLDNGEVFAEADWHGWRYGQAKFIADGARVWARMIPAADADLTQKRLRSVAGSLEMVPLGRGMSGDGGDTELGLVMYTISGVETIDGKEVRTSSDLIEFFTTGEAWVINGTVASDDGISYQFEEVFAWAADRFAAFAANAGLAVPIVLQFGVSGAKGLKFFASGTRLAPQLPRDEIRHECIVTETTAKVFLGEARRAAARVWEEAGLERPENLYRDPDPQT